MALHKLSDRERPAGGSLSVDVRDWDVRTRNDDEDVGKVRDVLVEDTGEARYFDVDLGIFSKRVLVPVERTTSDAANEVVWVDGFTKDRFEDIPKYDGDIDRLNADYREGLLRGYSSAGSTTGPTAGGTMGAGTMSTAPGSGSTVGGADRTTGPGAGRTAAHDARSDEAHRRADAAEQRAEAAEDRAEHEKERAKEEEKRAKEEEKRAEEEKDRVEETREASPVGDSQLGRLGEMSDYEVADYHEDVRGWDVVASDDRTIGEVKDLVADTAAMKVRYLDIELKRDFRRSDDEGRVLIPIQHARILKDPKSVRIDSLGSGQARDIPTHRGTYDRAYETRVEQVFPRSTTRNPTDHRR
jgi:photosynthetic reaction center H subunit